MAICPQCGSEEDSIRTGFDNVLYTQMKCMACCTTYEVDTPLWYVVKGPSYQEDIDDLYKRGLAPVV